MKFRTAILIVLCSGLLYAAGSLSITMTGTQSLKRIVLDWTSPDTGLTTSSLSCNVFGYVYRVTMIPDTAGGTDPNDLYDVELQDEDGIDILGGLGHDLSATTASSFCPTIGDLPAVVSGSLSLVVTNAGVSNGGKVVLYVRKID